MLARDGGATIRELGEVTRWNPTRSMPASQPFDSAGAGSRLSRPVRKGATG
ncbi:hypothetical protein [Sphingobium sp. CFD-2]|uniref:hypothetical protein n=1 Tax=Sphingobium sp. CFD-2 TaxID=2878542 RepID=UPI00214C0BE2|nr:hypothetical protein [Sphingobium sp. CFD-2]